MKTTLIVILSGLLVILAITPGLAQDSSPPTVRAVMFWMEGCSHCEEVIREVLPPLSKTYGNQFHLVLIEVASNEDVNRLFAVAESYGYTKEQTGVPFLIIGDQVLVGSLQVRDQLPVLIRNYLAQGGVDWPANPEIKPYLPQGEILEPNPAQAETQLEAETKLEALIPDETATIQTRNNGFALAIAVMIGMAIALVFSGVSFINGRALPSPAWIEWVIPLLIVIGMGVAGYLTYVETQMVEAVCGPLGDCNTVQTSPYARLFGIFPIGLLGLLGYVALMAAWIGRRLFPRFARPLTLAFWGMSIFAVIFSFYLTYLEPFVIRAVCLWCITSAVIVTLLLLFSTPLAIQQTNTQDEGSEYAQSET